MRPLDSDRRAGLSTSRKRGGLRFGTSHRSFSQLGETPEPKRTAKPKKGKGGGPRRRS